MRLLIIDDEPIVLKALAMVLRRDGHTVDKARGGLAGIESFQAAVAAGQPFDAVITDFDMSDADGHQVAREVKAASPTTPVLLFTGWGDRAAQASDGAAVDRVLDKMSPLEELRGALQAIAGIKN
jgi:DNA-binding NtrC family response regulator